VSNEHVQSVEVSDDQNTVRHTRRLEFVAAACANGRPTCVVCVANGYQELCDRLPCSEHTRTDGRDGYFREVRG
jgi:hypothetical protein